MRIKSVIFALLIAIAVSMPATAGEQPALQQLSEHVYAYVGAKNADHPTNRFGENTGLVVGDKAALVIDTLVSAHDAELFLADIRKITNKPIKYVVNTHFHLDHALGNCVFVKQGAKVTGHVKGHEMVKNAEYALAHPENYEMTARDFEGTTIEGPTSTFGETMSIDLGGVKVVLSYLGATHTPDSIIVEIPSEKTLFVGDLLFTEYHPFLAEGDFSNWRKALTRMIMRPEETIIPGHGPISSKKDLKDMREYLICFDKLATRLCAGKSIADSSAVAKEMLSKLPQQGRNKIPFMVEANLKIRYLQSNTDSKHND